MSLLRQFGWENFNRNLNISLSPEPKPGRVISIKGFKYVLVTDTGELETELSGKLLFGNTQEDLPKVGDWVQFLDYETMGYIVDLLPRKNMLSRKNPGAKNERQILATNIDHAFIVQGLDRDFNMMRLERYLVQMSACEIPSTVILNKADLVDDAALFVAEVEKLQRDIRIMTCSTVQRSGIDQICQAMKPGETHIMIGSSGVGKSTLLNAMMGNEVQETGVVSLFNQKGRHTTTARELFKLPNGALIIDTPGMREFGVTFEIGSTDDQLFPAIYALAGKCRYSDCQHISENGCAVLDAMSAGELDSVVYYSYIKLLKEQRRFQVTADEKKRMGKQFGKITKEAKAHRKKYKY